MSCFYDVLLTRLVSFADFSLAERGESKTPLSL